MTAVSKLLEPFAASIQAKAGALRKLNLTRSQRARLLESISDDIKKCSNFMTPGTSRAALKEAIRLKVSLGSKTWHDQSKFDRGRKLFHFEHFVPVSSIREACLKNPTKVRILQILKRRLRVIWILKAEDRKLTQLGFRSRRLHPELAYRAAKIKLAAKQRVSAGGPRAARSPRG